MNWSSYPREPFGMKVIEFSQMKYSLLKIFSSLGKSSFQESITLESEKLAILRPTLKYGKDFNTRESYMTLYNVSLISNSL